MTHHGAGLLRLKRDEALVNALRDDYTTANITPAERAMLDYAAKLTCTPKGVTSADIEALQAVGLTARAIHDLCAIVGYFAFVNRLADGLGVELESWWPPQE